MHRILISDKLGAAGTALLDQIADVSYDLKPGLSKEALIATIGGYDALIIRSGTQVDADILAAAGKLQVIGRAGIGVDNVDVEAATSAGVIVMNTPTANSIATAEQTMALMLALSRHTAAAHQSLKSGQWQRSQFVGVELHAKTLGIIGFGSIGRLVARRAQAFGMEVLAYDPFVSEEVGRALDVTLVDLEDLLNQSDYITLHAAVVPATIKMINQSTIAMMKDGVRLINAARGKLVDEADLAAALTSGKVAAAAIDVYSSEPPPPDHPLIGLPNVLHTPHLGASTVEAQRAVAAEIVQQVVDALRGTDFRHAVNMPFPAGPNFNTFRPYMDLAERLGSLHSQLAGGDIKRVEVEVHGSDVIGLVRAIAAALLKGIIGRAGGQPVNYINAPVAAIARKISISQTRETTPIDYPNLISVRVKWDGGENLLAGTLFGGRDPRVVRINDFVLDARPTGILLILLNQDHPGVVGQIGTILAAHQINIGEWRMGRDRPGGAALSVINLDNAPEPAVLDELAAIDAVTGVDLVTLQPPPPGK